VFVAASTFHHVSYVTGKLVIAHFVGSSQ